MSIFSDIVDRFRTKQPQYAITDFNTFQDYSYLNDSQNYLDQYESWTYKACKTKADAFINFDQILYRKGEIDEEVENDQLLKDLHRFNGFQTYKEARQVTRIHLDLTGTAFWVMTEAKNGKNRVEFYILNPTKVTIKTDQFGLPKAYVFTDSNGQENVIEPDNLIYFKEPNPKNWLKGWGALQASRYAHNTNELAHKYNMNWFGNSGRPEGFLIAEGISEPERQRLETMLKQKYGSVRNSRKVGVLNKKIEYLEVMKTQKELDFANSINAMRDEILALHGVPKALVGLDDSTYNNAEQAIKIFQQYTLKPMLELEMAIYNEQLIPKYYKKDREDIYFHYEDPVEEDQDANVERTTKLYQAGIITLNEARKEIGEDEVDDGDEFKSEVIELPMEEEKPEEDNDELKEELQKMRKMLNDQARLIKSIPDLAEREQNSKKDLKTYFLNKNLENEKTFKQVAVQYFNDQAERVLASVKGKKAIKAGMEYDREVAIAVEMFMPEYQRMLFEFNKVANELTGGEVQISDAMLKKIRDNVQYFSEEINTTTQKKLQELIAQAITENWTTLQLSKEIKALFDSFSFNDEPIKESRSDTIARTEVNWTKNMSFRDNFARNKFVEGFEWLATLDEFTRESHAEADGLFRPKGYKFPIWSDELGRYEYLEYPGDRGASAGNTINCRCTLIPVVNMD